MEGQPTLLPEGAYTDAERAFIELSPPGMWPENQDSNFGQVRKVFTDIVQEMIDEVDHLGEEMFVASASEYLNLWESIVTVPIAPAGKTDTQRRSIIAPRLQYGPFTRARLRAIVEGFITPTFGEAVSLTPAGVSLTAGGVPLYSGTFSLTGTYRIYEDVRDYSYAVWIRSDVAVDTAALLKELQRVTPSGITVTLDNSRANVLNYHRTVRNKQPVAYFRVNGVDATDESGYGNNGSFPGGNPTAVAGPGLLDAAVQHDIGGAGDGALDFSNVAHYLSAPNHALYTGMRDLSLEAWIRVDVMPPTSYGTIFYKDDSWQMRVNAGGSLGFFVKTTDPAEWAGRLAPGGSIVAGSVYHVVGVKRGTECEVWINGVRSDTVSDAGVVPDTILPGLGGPLQIGGVGFVNTNFDGVLDELAVYNRALSAEEILENYNTGRNVA